MLENPYESPRCESKPPTEVPVLRKQALRSFRVAALVLYLPAIYNLWAFEGTFARRPVGILTLEHTISGLMLATGGMLIWFFELPTLEAIARFLRSVLARRTDAADWQNVLYRSLFWMPYLAAMGAVLWMVWVFGFYQLKVNFFVLSWAVGIPAHLLGACWYVPLIYRWYRLATA